MSHTMEGHPRQTGHGGEFWQNEVHWRREWKTTSVFLPWEPHAAAAAKSLQSCLTLSDLMDCSLPGSSIHGIFQARVLEWGAIVFSMRTPWTVWKGKKIGHWKMNSPGQLVPIMLLEISREIIPERMKRQNQRKNNTQLWMWLMMEVKSNAVKNNIA